MDVQPGARADVFFEISVEALKLVNEAGERVVAPGSYELSFSLGDGSKDVTYQFHVDSKKNWISEHIRCILSALIVKSLYYSR